MNQQPKPNFRRLTKDVVPTRPCPICCGLIPAGARLCVLCKSDLTWRRHLTIGNSSLALVTALVAVVGSTAQNLVRLIEPEDKLAIDVLSSTSDDLSLRVANQGERSIVLTRLAVRISGPGFLMRHHFAPLDTRDTEVALDPGQRERVTVTQLRGAIHAATGFDRGHKWPDSSSCSLEAKFVGVGGRAIERSFPMDCNGSLSEFLFSRWTTSKIAGPIPAR
jgi:hypothetical protein